MKKIVSVLAIAALTLGSVFAEVSLAFTQKGYISNKVGATVTRLNTNGYKAKVSDCVVFKLSNDVCGAVFDIDPYYNANKVYGFDFDQYYGWINFMNGALKVQSGVWTNRNVNRINADAGQWESSEYEAYKPGVIGGYLGQDISSLTAIVSAAGVTSTPQSFSVGYNAGSFFATGAIVSNTYGKFDSASGFALEAGLKLGDKTGFNAIVKNQSNEEYAFGVFANTKAIDKLDFMGGFTFGTATDKSALAVKYTEWAIDLRARYDLSDVYAVTTMNNLSSKKADGADKATLTVWDMVSLSAKIKDTVKATVTGEWNYADLSVNNTGTLSVIPGVEFAPAAGCSVTTGVIFNFGSFGTSSNAVTCSSVAIPFILHVSL